MNAQKNAPRSHPTIRYLLFSIIFILVLFAMIFISARALRAIDDHLSDDTVISEESEQPVVIIDAGHGGEDGGAIGKNGAYEKDLNLSIARELAQMLRAGGIKVIMTRESDVLLYDRNLDYKGRKKQLDLAARLKIARETENCIFISIHMNAFPEEKYRGLQVYYSPHDERSKLLAQKIQATVCEHLQPSNSRSIKKASSNIYLLDRATYPAVLIECGFLSNEEECALLCDSVYRRKLSLAMFYAIKSAISESYS